jgi:hypothetical protein
VCRGIPTQYKGDYLSKDATLQRKSDLYTPGKETARPQSQIPNFQIHVSVSDLYIPKIGPPIFQWADRLWEYISRSQKHKKCRNKD